MKILARTHLWPPEHCAGAERMLQAMLAALTARGHDVEVHLARRAGHRTEPYTLDGATIYPSGTSDWRVAARTADVLVTHLDQTSEVVLTGIVLDRPVVQVLHNTHAPTRMWASCKTDLLVYNSAWLARTFPPHDNAIIVRPPVTAADYAAPDGPGDRVTLINLYEPKGGLIFAMLAAAMPHVEFLGVKGGYGEQIVPHLPNVEIVEHGAWPMTEVYGATAVLLMPSSYESWGRTGVEAMCSGIPVIANPTPGLIESLGPAGIFCELDDLAAWQHEIDHLLHGPRDHYARASARAHQRAAELDPTDDLALWCRSVEAL